MTGFGRQISAIALSLAVLLVSATCTSAGCLLQTAFPPPATAPERACCAAGAGRHHGGPHLPPGRNGGKDCPLCHNAALVAKAAEQGGHAKAPGLSPVFFLAAPGASPTAPPANGPCAAAGCGGPPDLPASTLLALHCALLN